jgi:hypothetical protein
VGGEEFVSEAVTAEVLGQVVPLALVAKVEQGYVGLHEDVADGLLLRGGG